jgi:hypothetical protein
LQAYSGTLATQEGYIRYNSSQFAYSDGLTGVSTQISVQSTAVLRDPSAWYHLMVVANTPSATASERIQLYINGSRVTALSATTYPSQNFDTGINRNVATRIGTRSGTSEFFDGYMAEVNFIDGQALTPASFGSTNALTGVWQPAPYTGTYGTNGFYLPFTSIGSASTSSYSGNFNGSSQYLTYPNSSNFAFGTAAFTIEFFINGASNNDKFILGGRSAIGTMHITTGGSGSTAGVLRYVGSSTIVSPNVITDSSYHHCAIVRDGSNNVKLYVDGALVASGTDTTNYTTTSGTWYIGTNDVAPGSNLLAAALSNLRVVKGTAVYTAAFTPPSSPLTAVSGTSLLTLQSSTIIDNSGNSVSISNTGSVTTSVSYPFVGNVGADFSGNNNNWSTNNISLTAGVTYDSMTDVPTLTSATAANYAVLNPLSLAGSGTGSITNGNLTITSPGTDGTGAQTAGSIAVTSSKYYFEGTFTTLTSSSGFLCFGVQDGSVVISGLSGSTRASTNAWWISDDGNYRANGGTITASGLGAFSAGNVAMIAIDASTGKGWIGKNGTWVGDPAAGTGNTFSSLPALIAPFAQAIRNTTTSSVINANFGQRPFTYTPPTDFVALNTFNLPASTIVKGNVQMDATIWTGDGTSPKSQTNAAGFQPDLVWIKSRSSAYSHNLFDSVRGAGLTRSLQSDNTNSETTNAVNTALYGYLSAFNSNGFSTTNGTDPTSSSIWVNASGQNYVGWQWKAGGAAVTNTAGSISAQVSANPTAGFSVITYSGNATSGATVGHGLGVAPKMVIVKSRTNSGTNYEWFVYHVNAAASPQNGYLLLNLVNAYSTAGGSAIWNNTAPSSSVVTLGNGNTNLNSNNYVAYVFSEIAGFSKFGGYTGNGSADGVFIYTGFRPKFLLIKKTDSSASWILFDSARNTYNIVQNYLLPDSSIAEGTGASTFDFVSNGIKLRSTSADSNASGGTYVYMAFAENPFKNSLAR